MLQCDTVNKEDRGHYLAAFEEFDQLINQLSSDDFGSKTFGEIEAHIQQKGMEVLRLLAQGHLKQRGDEEKQLDKLVSPDGESRTHRRSDCVRQIESLFGEVEANRIGYRGNDLGILYPLDQELNLSPDKYSHGLRGEIANMVATQSFDEALDFLEKRGGGTLPKRQIQEVAAHLISDFEDYYKQPLESKSQADHILVISGDGKGISIYNQDLREETRKLVEANKKKNRKRLQPGEKRGRKRMATVVSVYEIAPYHRTPEQIMSKKEGLPTKRPKPVNKRVWADVVEDMGNLIDQGFQEAIRRDPEQTMPWVVLIDGQPELIRQVERKAEQYTVKISIVQDFIHVTEYLWKASHALHPVDVKKREEWVTERSLEILRGNARNVATGLRRTATLYKLDEKERVPVDTAANYIANNRKRLRYDEALKQGFPIATGVIEGACRYLVKDRMDITGARWRLTSANAVLKLRSLKANGDLCDYLQFHFQQEKKRNYFLIKNNEMDFVAT